ncbi:hypothetical protein NDU88_004492 [Pleurodeles waltl]|uniref:Uncharacterized protein n=1 Tax=Pleurodeles waltl TaxID=8319 RepID=A0AAV7QF66_PLEWA|nr:hypothetical protein NDU88_004492 [Pleurodeles waltl]
MEGRAHHTGRRRRHQNLSPGRNNKPAPALKQKETGRICQAASRTRRTPNAGQAAASRHYQTRPKRFPSNGKPKRGSGGLPATQDAACTAAPGSVKQGTWSLQQPHFNPAALQGSPSTKKAGEPQGKKHDRSNLLIANL